jgi:hypothetical protein
MQYLGIDWAYRRAAWCARSEGGAITGEGVVPADEDGLIKLVLAHGTDVKACVEMMSGAVWVRDRLAAAGWHVQVAHAGKVRDVAPLACKTDKVDARVLAELCRRDLVPALWIPSLDDRALRERLRRRTHLVRLRASAMNRIFGLLTQWGLRGPPPLPWSQVVVVVVAVRNRRLCTDFSRAPVSARASPAWSPAAWSASYSAGERIPSVECSLVGL